MFYCTLERLSDPEAVLTDLKSRLTPAGVVMVIGPTIDSRTARLFRSAWWEFNPQNLHYFSADTLQSLLLKCGYGDPIIDSDDCAVSLEYFKRKDPCGLVGLLPPASGVLVVSATPGSCDTAPFVRSTAGGSLLARSKPVARSRRCRSSWPPTTRKTRYGP